MKNTIILIGMFLLSVTIATAQMRVHLINVGQGCATLVEFPCGAILIDAGGESNSLFDSKAALKTYLEDFFKTRPDLNHTFNCVYLTHPHKDHTLGVPVILQSPYIIKNVVTDGLESGSGKAGQIALHRLVQRSDSTPSHADDIGFEAITTNEIGANGMTNAVIDPVNCTGTDPKITVLWGQSTTIPSGWNQGDFKEVNNHSLVIRIQYGAASFIVTGDLEDPAQHSLIEKYSSSTILDADVYLVGHHGSKNGSSQELIDKITPKMALIGCGDVVRETVWTAWAYGHPNKGTLDRLQGKINLTRAPIEIQAGTGAKTFVDYTVTKAIYATGWDDNVVLEANADGIWRNVDEVSEPASSLVNVNTASVTSLQSLPGIGGTRAKAIVDYRTAHGLFHTIGDLDNVTGIGPATIKLLQSHVAF